MNYATPVLVGVLIKGSPLGTIYSCTPHRPSGGLQLAFALSQTEIANGGTPYTTRADIPLCTWRDVVRLVDLRKSMAHGERLINVDLSSVSKTRILFIREVIPGFVNFWAFTGTAPTASATYHAPEAIGSPVTKMPPMADGLIRYF